MTKIATKHWWRLLPEAGDTTCVRDWETTARQLAELDARREQLIRRLEEYDKAALDEALTHWSEEDIDAAKQQAWRAAVLFNVTDRH